jgi:3-hydroxyacyl-[acyl-carrier-protein] dehydratase
MNADRSSSAEAAAIDIRSAIPHRPPMLLIDEVVKLEGDQIVCRKRFDPSEFFVQGHFPGYPLVPGVIQCETALQAGAILLSKVTPQDGSVVPVVTRLDQVRFKRMVRPGETVEIQVRLTESLHPAYYMTGQLRVEGKLAARLDFVCSVASPEPAAGSGESSPS